MLVGQDFLSMDELWQIGKNLELCTVRVTDGLILSMMLYNTDSGVESAVDEHGLQNVISAF